MQELNSSRINEFRFACSSSMCICTIEANSYVVSTPTIENVLPIVKIENGPVDSGFNGELITLFKTLDN